MRIATITIAVAMCLFTLSCYDERQIKNIADQAREEGRKAGYQAGKAEAYPPAFESAEKAAYKATVYELYTSGQFVRKRNYTILALTIPILLGFLLQYGLFYLVRLGGVSDIDRIVLSGALIAVMAAGCIDVDKIRKQAYNEGFETGHASGLHDGEEEGTANGYKSGVLAAHVAAANGDAWQLYVVPAFCALAFGVVAGVLLQYVVLLYCRRFRAIGQSWTTWFVPAIRSSQAYARDQDSRRIPATAD